MQNNNKINKYKYKHRNNKECNRYNNYKHANTDRKMKYKINQSFKANMISRKYYIQPENQQKP